MRTKSVLTSDDIKKMAGAAEALANANGWAVTIAIFDDGGHLLYLHRLDNAAPTTVELAISKGRLSATGRRESKAYEEIVKNRMSFLSVPLSGMVEGGVPIVVDGDVVGAFGVSGARADQDVAIAHAGIAALDLD